MMYDGWMWGHGLGWAGWTMVCIVMVVFWAAVITAVVVAIRYASGSTNNLGTQATYGPPRPQDVLADRFARGEIDEDEYRQRAAVLHQQH